MKKISLILSSILVLLLFVGSVSAYNGEGMNLRGKGYGQNQGGQTYTLYDDTQINHQQEIDSYPVQDLDQNEIDGLLLMREEEKLARDVYLTLYDIYGQQIFSNIARSESTHTEAIKSLLDKYEIEDPMQTDDMGVFENEELQQIYNQLVEQGSDSLLAALKVGATVEDLDIKDLQELKESTDNDDITAVYDNLEKGSRNHLRSFIRLIEKNGGTYEVKYISQDYYNSIISGDMETGNEYSSKGPNEQEVRGSGNGMNDGLHKNQIIENSQANQFNNEEKSQSTLGRMWRGIRGVFTR